MSLKHKPYHIEGFVPETVAIQGQPCSFSDGVCSALFNDSAAMQYYDTFEEPFDVVAKGRADAAVIPIQNTLAGHVPYVHKLLRENGLRIVGEYYEPIKMNLLVLPDADISEITVAHSHMHALNQCGGFFASHPQIARKIHADTAGAAKMILDKGDRTQASISSEFAARRLGLKIAAEGIQDDKRNITRFVVLTKATREIPYQPQEKYITTIILKPRSTLERKLLNVLKVFEECGVMHTNPVAFEGPYMVTKGFYIELSGHTSEPHIMKALDMLRPRKDGQGISTQLDIAGTYPAHHYHRFGRHLT